MRVFFETKLNHKHKNFFSKLNFFEKTKLKFRLGFSKQNKSFKTKLKLQIQIKILNPN